VQFHQLPCTSLAASVSLLSSVTAFLAAEQAIAVDGKKLRRFYDQEIGKVAN
jgi:hypothetical protein